MGKKQKNSCPCGSGIPYENCCEPFISGNKIPKIPEQLMRSRYTAYVEKDFKYLLSTWHSSTRPASLDDENNLPVKWIELRILNAPEPGSGDHNATVEFVARYKVNGKAEQMHEVSKFIKEERWYYLRGEIV